MKVAPSLTILLVSLVSVGALACDDHFGQCEIEAWRTVFTSGILAIEGSATCNSGGVQVRLYDDDQFIGVASGIVDGHVVRAFAHDIAQRPQTLSIKYSIEPW